MPRTTYGETIMQSNNEPVQSGNTGKTGGLSRPVEGQSAPATKYVHEGVNPFVISAGVVVLLAAIVLVYLLIRRRHKA